MAHFARLDSLIDQELDRLGWSSTTAPEGSSTLDCWDTETPGVVVLHDTQEVTAFHGPALLDTLRALPDGTSWDDVWQAILPHMLDE